MSEIGVNCLIFLVKAGVFICDVVSYPVHAVLNRKDKDAQDIYKVKKTKVTEGLCYSGNTVPTDLQNELTAKKIDTVQKAHAQAVDRFPDKNSLGTRQILKEFEEDQPNGKVFKKYELGDYSWLTYREVDERAKELSCGFRQLGCNKESGLMILSETRAEWLLSAIAAFKQSIPVCTLYATLGPDGLMHGINETETKVLVTSHDMMPKVKAILKDCPHLETIIYFPDQLNETNTEGFGDIDVYSIEEVMQIGRENHYEDNVPEPDDVAVVMYTSGSTGTPKGVVLSHKNLMAAMYIYIGEFDPRPEDRYVGYLPLAHVLELIAENIMFALGVPIGYGTALTLTDRSTKVKRGQLGDVSVLKPTFFTAVPLVLDRLYKGILEKVAAQSRFLQKLFAFGMEYKRYYATRGVPTPFCDWFIFRKIRALLGGKLRLLAAGGAPLSAETHEFMALAMGVPVLQGYGLTETCGCAALMPRKDKSVGRVGQPLLNCDIKLIDWEESNYLITDKPHPRGEIVIGGDHVAVGYYKQPEKTREEFVEIDGKRWFKTGDIGLYESNGALKIIDRKKDLVKLQIGEYVSLAKVEGVLASCVLIDNICVYGDSQKNNVVAIISPNSAALKELAQDLKLSGKSDDELCLDEKVNQHFLNVVVNAGKKANLQKFEMPTAVHLSSEMWTPDSGLVTAAFKLKRVAIKRHYSEAIKKMYGA